MKKNKLPLTQLHVRSFITNLDDPHAQTIKGGVSDNAACGTGGGPEEDTVASTCVSILSDGALCAALSINPACPSQQTCQATCNNSDQPQDMSWGGG